MTIYKIYLITNLITKLQYIGYTEMTLEKRFYSHCRKDSKCVYLNKAIQKYGKDNFKIEEICSTKSEIDIEYLERFFIQKFNTVAPNGYNLQLGGFNGKMSEITKEKMGKTTKERWSKKDINWKSNTLRGITDYVENKRIKIIGINITDQSILKFKSQLDAELSGFHPIGSLCGKDTHSGNYCWFYDDELPDSVYIEKTRERIGEFGEYKMNSKYWNDPEHKKQRIQLMIEGSQKVPLIAISRFDLSVREFDSWGSAIREGFQCIHQSLDRTNKHAYDYCWFRKEDNKTIEQYQEEAIVILGDKFDATNVKPIVSKCVNTGLTKEYNNLYDAENQGFRISGIRRVLRGVRKVFDGFTWKFK